MNAKKLRLKVHAKSNQHSDWIFYSIALIGMLISALLWYGFIRQANDNLQHIIDIEAKHIANDIEEEFNQRFNALKQVAKHITLSNNSPILGAEDNDILAGYPGIAVVAWTDGFNTPQYLRPSELSLAALTQAMKSVLANKPQPRTELSFVFNLANLSNAFMIRMPASQGFIVGVLNLNTIFSSIISNNDYVTKIYDNEREIFQFGSDRAEKTFAGFPIRLANTTVLVRVYPSLSLKNAVETKLPYITLILGVFIALLFAINSRLIYHARGRASILNNINQNLKKEIADREHAEKANKVLEKALLQGQKLQAIGTLAGGIAHDFNNLLYAIMGYVEMALEDTDKTSQTHKNLGKVLEAAKRGQELVSRILTFSRRQPYDFSEISLLDTIHGVLDLLKAAIPSSVSIHFKSALSGPAIISGNTTHLHQVIMNIINNAVDANGKEGEIEVTLSSIEKSHPLLKSVPHIAALAYYKLEITDHGHGMDEYTQERIFEPFFTTKEVDKGTGLGLSTAHSIIKEHQGDIIVQSQLGQGTTFTILIPALS